MGRIPNGGAGVASPVHEIYGRSVIVPRSTSISGGAIAGAVVGSVVGVALIALCAYPFIRRAWNKARGKESPSPFDPEAEIQQYQHEAAAAAAAGGSAQSTPTSPKQHSTLPTAQAGAHDDQRESKEAGSNASYYATNAVSPATATADAGVAASHAAYPTPEQQFPGRFSSVGPQRTSTFQTGGTMDTTTTSPHPGRSSRRSTRSSISNAIKSASAVFRRTSTRSLPVDDLDSTAHDPTVSLPPSFVPVNNIPPATGEAASYYGSPPPSALSPGQTAPYPAIFQPVVNPGAFAPPAQSMQYASRAAPAPWHQQLMQQEQLSQQNFSPLESPPLSPTSLGTSPRIKEEVLSEDEEYGVADRSGPVGGEPPRLVKRMTFPKQLAKMPVSPSQAAPGTVNPMDIMGPTNASERSWRVQSELVKIETSPPPHSPPAAMPANETIIEQPESNQQQQSPPPQSHQEVQTLQTPKPAAQSQQQQQQYVAATPNPALDYGSPESMPGGGEIGLSFNDYVDLEEPTIAAQQLQSQPQPQYQPQQHYQPAVQQQQQTDNQQQFFVQNQDYQIPPQQQFDPQTSYLQPQNFAQQTYGQHTYDPQTYIQQGFDQQDYSQQGFDQQNWGQQGYDQQNFPHTSTYIKPEQQPSPPHQVFTPALDFSDYSTPNPASQSSVASNGTPDTRLTPSVSQFTGTPSPAPNAAPHSPENVPGPDASPRTFACDQCNRTFDQIHKLNHHRRYHERPHMCEHCDKRFGTKTHLDRHVNDKHMKTRKYHCIVDGCQFSRTGDRAFPRKDNWRRHMVHKHGLNPEQDPVEVMDQPMGGYGP